MKYLILFLISSEVFANLSIEENIYRALKKNNAFIQSTSTNAFVTNVINLEEIRCQHLRKSEVYECTFKEFARPYEYKKVQGNDAAILFNELIEAGIKSVYVFGYEYLNVQVLKCVQQKSYRNNDSKYSCMRLRALLD